MTRRLSFVPSLGAICVLSLAFAAQARAQDGWIVPGATGTPDESSFSSVSFNDAGTVSLKPGATAAVLRYPVLHTVNFDWYESEDHTVLLCMRAVMRDTGPGARVVLKLQEIATMFSDPDTAGASVRTLLTIDSNTAIDEGTSGPLQGSTDYRMAVACTNTTGPVLAWGQHAYFVEATLTRSSSSANPGLKAIELDYEAY